MMHGNQTVAPLADMLKFGYGDHLSVWTMRRIATGKGACPLVSRELLEACGEDAAEVFATFRTFLGALGASRRPLQIGDPGCLALTADERQLLTLIAAAQADSSAYFEAQLRWLARADFRQGLAIATRALGTALKVNDLWLSLPASIGPMMCERDTGGLISASLT